MLWRDVAVADLGVVTALGLDGLLTGFGRAARVQARVAASDRLALLHQAVVGGEREHPVVGVVEGLEALQAVAVGLEDVDAVLVGVANGQVADHRAVRAVEADRHVLDGAHRSGVARLHAAGVDDDVVGGRTRTLKLKVALDAWAGGGDPAPLLVGRLRRVAAEGAAADVDQALVVRTLQVVGVREGVGLGLVVLLQQVGAAGVVGRRGPRLRLGVDAGHDHDAVVVLGLVHGVLDRVEVALREEPLVQLDEALGLLRADELALGVRPQLVAAVLRGVHRLVQPLQRALALADHARLARRLRLQGREEVARLRHLAARGRLHVAVKGGVGPVGGPLDVSERDGRAHQQRRADGDRNEPALLVQPLPFLSPCEPRIGN